MGAGLCLLHSAADSFFRACSCQLAGPRLGSEMCLLTPPVGWEAWEPPSQSCIKLGGMWPGGGGSALPDSASPGTALVATPPHLPPAPSPQPCPTALQRL